MSVELDMIHKLLDGAFWPKTLKARQSYSRTHDDCEGRFHEVVEVTIDEMGDAYVVTHRELRGASLRFRTFGGGGASPRVRNALLILAEAIRLDNEEEEVSDGCD